jgi:hypothetical protein
MNPTTFALSRFQNRNGAPSWRVSGYVAGIRIRRNFKTREEAAVGKTALQLQAIQSAGGGVRMVSTFLTDDQLREAEGAFRRLTAAPQSLGFYLDYALGNYRAPERTRALSDAVKDYLAAKELERTQGHLNTRQLYNITHGLKALEEHFPGLGVPPIRLPPNSRTAVSRTCWRSSPACRTGPQGCMQGNPARPHRQRNFWESTGAEQSISPAIQLISPRSSR